jgi:hypothetical protein
MRCPRTSSQPRQVPRARGRLCADPRRLPLPLPLPLPQACAELESRLAASERKVYALGKERDALRKSGDKLADASTLLKEKDDIIKQVGVCLCVGGGGGVWLRCVRA